VEAPDTVVGATDATLAKLAVGAKGIPTPALYNSLVIIHTKCTSAASE
jgi:hypothetical protein